MALVVEDGTGLTNSDALLSLAEWKAHADGMGWDYTAKSDDEIEQGVRRTSAAMSAMSWKGLPLRGRDQALAWPRVSVVDGHGYPVPTDAVPREVKLACAEMSWREVQSPGSLFPDYTASGAVKREKFGPVEFEYVGSIGPQATNVVIPIVRDLLRGLLKGYSLISGTAVRR